MSAPLTQYSKTQFRTNVHTDSIRSKNIFDPSQNYSIANQFQMECVYDSQLHPTRYLILPVTRWTL